MPRLSIRLFGAVRVTLEEEPVTGFESDKARALLAYLAVEADRAHQREKLAGMLWPESTEQVARAYLRRLLVNVRRAIGDHESHPPPLHITRQTIQFNMLSDSWVDVTAFLTLVLARGSTDLETIHRLEEAVELCRGAFLEGFSGEGFAAGGPAETAAPQPTDADEHDADMRQAGEDGLDGAGGAEVFKGRLAQPAGGIEQDVASGLQVGDTLV